MNANILILDDNEEFTCLLEACFSHAGFKVESHLHPREALEAFASREFDLVVTDYQLPGMSGLEVVKRVKQSEPDVPVFLISGALDAGQIREAKTAGATEVYLKPLDVFALIANGESLTAR